ncbi:NXPE family member 3-like [Micropterus salmoides]|uniref:NXPE family member 3-like n=1 Tax=Micropterus salmoides TaxID=27706 RepID=UPI0018EC75E6|nr:NXPE family member 3-like [Micropterus salmoides]XP_038594840.1 NXPE family member 3-like [Micropterus salmoides]
MKVRACIRKVVSMRLTKYRIIVIFFIVLSQAVFGFIFVLRKMDFLEHKVKPTIPAPDRDINQVFCTFQSLSKEESVEERLLLDSIAWPETPLLLDPLSLEQTSDSAHSKFIILPGRGGGRWHVGDQLEIMIKMYDFQGRPKKSGGDVVLTRLHNLKLGAGVAGQVVDHLNGSYSAVFSLLWEGSAQVEVTLVHPSEAVTVLRRLTSEQPDRVYFHSLFRSGSLSETTTCNVCLRPTQQPLCNYTDLRTGEPWFCYKPKNLNCDARISHSMGGFNQNLKAEEEKLFQSGVNMKVSIQASGPANVTVLPKKKGKPEVKSSSVKSGPSGYYYQGAWRALGGIMVNQFNTSSAISQCLKGKKVHLYGDSTIRQWFEHLNAALPDLKEFNLHSPKQVGPFMALDYANNILVTYRCHGPPLRFGNVPTTELRYIANELDGLTGGSNTVVVIGIWSHFSTFPMELYIQRLQSIRRAVVRLLVRAPDTLVVIRTANLKALTLYETLTNSDWYSLQRDKVLRAVFKGLNVRLVDAWEMSLAHHLPHSLHPQPPIIKNMIDVLLSYICPQKGG